VATDLYSGKRIVLREGLVARAVRASCSIPGIFKPVLQDDMMLVDGGVTDRVPVSVVREMGADIVLAVDTGIYLQNHRIAHILDVISQSIDIMSKELSSYKLGNVDYIIRPDLQKITASQFHLAAQAIIEGEKAAKLALPEISKLLGRSDII